MPLLYDHPVAAAFVVCGIAFAISALALEWERITGSRR